MHIYGVEPTEPSKQPIITRYLGPVTVYQPIRDQYMLIRWSIPGHNHICNNAYVTMICLNTFFGITTTLTTFLVEFLAPNEIGFISFNNFLKYAFLLLPNYCLGRGIMDLAGNQFLNDIKVKFGYPTESPWEWELIGRNCVFMGATATFACAGKGLLRYQPPLCFQIMLRHMSYYDVIGQYMTS
eukprot:sb/3471465/